MSRDPGRAALIEKLISRAHAGDQEALNELFNRCRPMLKAWAVQRMGKSRRGTAGSSDVAQEALKRAFERFSTFRGTTDGEWKAWLRRIFINCLAELNRAAGRQKRDEHGMLSLDNPEVGEVPAQEESPSQLAAHQQEQERLLAYIFDLPGEQGTAIYYRCLKKVSEAQVARELDTTEAAIRGLLHRGTKALRARMVGDSIEDSDDNLEEPPLKSEVVAAHMLYLRLREAGKDIDRNAFLAEHAAYADELRPLLDAIDRILAIWNDAPDSEEQ